MLQAAAAFSGGILLKQKLDEVSLPQLRRATDSAGTFTLSVRVLAASVPGLDAPGLLSSQRPYLEGALGASKKETEFADYMDVKERTGPYAQECPWRFGDTLTFKARAEDLAGPGFRMTLRVRKDVVLGPVQFEMRPAEVGVGCLDLRQRVLPACVQEKVEGNGGVWQSPVVLMPLARVKDGPILDKKAAPGDSVATVAVVFSVDVNPDTVSGSTKRSATFSEKVEEGMDGVVNWLNKKVDAAISEKPEGEWRLDSCSAPRGWFANCKEPIILEFEESSERPQERNGEDGIFQGPDLSPEGWVCHRGPNGRTFWHHLALGPPPWGLEPPAGVEPERDDREVFDADRSARRKHQRRHMSCDLPSEMDRQRAKSAVEEAQMAGQGAQRAKTQREEEEKPHSSRRGQQPRHSPRAGDLCRALESTQRSPQGGGDSRRAQQGKAGGTRGSLGGQPVSEKAPQVHHEESRQRLSGSRSSLSGVQQRTATCLQTKVATVAGNTDVHQGYRGGALQQRSGHDHAAARVPQQRHHVGVVPPQAHHGGAGMPQQMYHPGVAPQNPQHLEAMMLPQQRLPTAAGAGLVCRLAQPGQGGAPPPPPGGAAYPAAVRWPPVYTPQPQRLSMEQAGGQQKACGPEKLLSAGRVAAALAAQPDAWRYPPVAR